MYVQMNAFHLGQTCLALITQAYTNVSTSVSFFRSFARLAIIRVELSYFNEHLSGKTCLP
jgi:hypothetical protein